MGWASSGDYMQGTSLKFKTKDQAMQFCTKQVCICGPSVWRILDRRNIHQSLLTLLNFDCHWCSQGWDYFVQEPHVHAMKPNVYASNYKHSPGKLRVHHTK